MPIPFIIGGIVAVKAVVGGVLATTAAKVAIGVVAAAIIHRTFSAKATISSLKEDVSRLTRENEKLKNLMKLQARITSIHKSGSFTKVDVGLYDDEEFVEECKYDMKGGIDSSEIYVGRSWMVYS